MSTPPPFVSILIVTWNRREELARAIQSALVQTYPAKEIVVVDNASTDGTDQMVRQQFPTVRMVVAPRNLGCPSGRNFGLQQCAGEYVFMLDDDGWLQEDAVALCVQRAEAHPSTAVVMAKVREVQDGRVWQEHPSDQAEPGYRADFSGG